MAGHRGRVRPVHLLGAHGVVTMRLIDRVTQREPTIYTPPEDIIEVPDEEWLARQLADCRHALPCDCDTIEQEAWQ